MTQSRLRRDKPKNIFEPSHLRLDKPKDFFEKASKQIEGIMENTKLEKILSKVENFPSMPAAGSKLLALLEEQEVSVNEVEDVLRCDPGLTANVLKLANSAYFGIPARAFLLWSPKT